MNQIYFLIKASFYTELFNVFQATKAKCLNLTRLNTNANIRYYVPRFLEPPR